MTSSRRFQPMATAPLTLRALVIAPGDIKAAMIWAGVTAPYELMQNGWKRGPNAEVIPDQLVHRRYEVTAYTATSIRTRPSGRRSAPTAP